MMDAKTDLGNVGVFMGGDSSEREISLKSGKAVFKALKESGCQVVELDIKTRDRNDIQGLIKENKIDIAFIALHGAFGEDGGIQSVLESLHIPYTGSGVEASRLAINKALTQECFQKNDIPVPEYQIVKKGQEAVVTEFPVVVKPVLEGSSFGISIVQDKAALSEALEKAFEYGEEALVDRYIRGRELTVGILGESALPIVEIQSKNNFFDFTAKYQKGMTKYILPAEIDSGLAAEIQQLALRAHEVIGCRDLSRVDLILDEHRDLYFLEINTIPGFTDTSLVPMAAQEVGINFNELCLKLIEFSYGKTQKK